MSRDGVAAIGSDLGDLQRWMLAVITHPEGLDRGLEVTPGPGADALDAVLTPGPALSERDRLAIYARMYYSRLIDILADDYACVMEIAGEEPFRAAARAYLAACPPTGYSIFTFDAAFADWIERERPDLPHLDLIVDVARLERAIDLLHSAHTEPPVDVGTVRSIPPDRWGDVRLRTISGLELLETRYPVHRLYSDHAEEAPLVLPEPQTAWMAVFRSGTSVVRCPLSRAQYALLGALAQGQRLEDALSACPGDEDVMDELGAWFQEWTTDGVFRAIELD